jgi:biopolymer transport protein ExbB
MPDFGVFAAWSSRKRIDLPIPTADLTDFPNCIKIVADADMTEALANGFDIRFVAADGVTELAYERESWSGGGGAAVTAIFWVKTDVAMAGTYIFCYFGNPSATDGADPENVWDANFKAVYHMKDATTSTILDSTANNNDGAKTGANEPIEATGKIGKGQDFDGVNDFIAAPSISVTQITLSAWIKPIFDANYKTFFDTGNLIMTVLPDRVIEIGVEGFAGVASSPVLGDDWLHFVGIVNGANALFYFNGALDSTRANQEFTSGIVNLGRYSGGGQNYKGLLDEIRLSSIARSAEWIAYEYANMNPADGGLTWGDEEHTAVPAGGMKPMDLRLKL